MSLRPPKWRSPYTVAAVCRAGVQVSSLLGMLVAVAELSPAIFGAFSVAWVTTVIANTLLYSGSYEYILRVKDIERAKHDVFWVFMSQGLLSSLVLFGGAAIASFDHNEMARTCFLAMTPIPPCAAYGAWCDGMLTRQGHAATVGAGIFFGEFCGAIALVVALRLGWGGAALLAWRLSATAVSLSGLIAFTDSKPRFRCTIAGYKTALRAALPLQGTTLLNSLSTYAADLLLAWRFSPAASASYRAAARVAVTGSDVFIQPLRSMTWAAMGERERGDDLPGMRKVYLDQLRMLTFFAWPTLFSLSLFSGRLFASISSADWSEAGTLLAWLAVGRAVSLLYFFFGPVLVCTGRSAAFLRRQTIITVIQLCLLALFTLQGALAVAICDMVLQIAIAGYATFTICRALALRPLEVVQALLPACLVSAVCAVLGELSYHMVELAVPLRLGISIGVMGIGLLGCFALLRERLAIRLPGASQA
jgi:O-antigen/teichoic acid export membrane protein